MYAAIRQGKAKSGMAEELAVRIKEGAIPIISDVPGFKAYYVIYAPDDTVTAISIFLRLRWSPGIKQTRPRMDRTELGTVANRTSHSSSWAGYRPYFGLGPRWEWLLMPRPVRCVSR